MAKEEALREEALAMHQHGKSVSEIARELNRSRQWVYKWLGRYSSGQADWSSSISNAPHIRPNKTSSSLVDEVKAARLELKRSPYHESGAYAIFHHLEEKGIEPPSVATINHPYSGETQQLVKGGDVEGGHAIVGEDGPELLSLTGGGARVTPLNDNNNAFVSVEKKLDTLIAILKNGFAVNIDGTRMVGALAPAMNNALGQMTASERRAFA